MCLPNMCVVPPPPTRGADTEVFDVDSILGAPIAPPVGAAVYQLGGRGGAAGAAEMALMTRVAQGLEGMENAIAIQKQTPIQGKQTNPEEP